MKAVVNFMTSLFLLVVLATLPGTLVAFRTMYDRMNESVAAAGSSMTAECWARAFGP